MTGRPTRVAAALVALLAAACESGTGPKDGADALVTSFTVTAFVGDWSTTPSPSARPATARVEAYIQLGLDERGRRRTYAGDALRFGDTTAIPLPLGPGAFRWEGSTRPSPVDARLRIQVPAIPGLTPPVPELVLRTPMRAGSDTVRLTAGAPLRLPIRLPTGPSVPAGQGSWTLSVQRAGLPAEYVALTGSALPPAELVVPAEMLPPPGTEGAYDVSLIFQDVAFTLPDAGSAGYRVVGTASTRLIWRALVVPSAGG